MIVQTTHVQDGGKTVANITVEFRKGVLHITADGEPTPAESRAALGEWADWECEILDYRFKNSMHHWRVVPLPAT